MADDLERLKPTLDEAQETLRASLAQACSTDPEQADTGELIRLEEILTIASDAAKRAVSVRRRLRQRKRRPTPPGGTAAGESAGDAAPRVQEGHEAGTHPAFVHRNFRDAQGVEWSVWAVFPDQRSRASLRGPFSKGWLTFEAGEERRRLSPIPESWDELDEAGLVALCEVAARVPRTRRGGAPSGSEEPPPLDPGTLSS